MCSHTSPSLRAAHRRPAAGSLPWSTSRGSCRDPVECRDHRTYSLSSACVALRCVKVLTSDLKDLHGTPLGGLVPSEARAGSRPCLTTRNAAFIRRVTIIGDAT
jgi:hypothetical protein